MPITAKILTKIELPEQVQVEVIDTVRGTKEVMTVDFHVALQELGSLGSVDLHELDPAELIAMASALAKHRAMDDYLISLGIDPHAHLHPGNQEGEG